MIGAVVYVRVSDPRQAENMSLTTQLKAGEEYCERQGFVVVERFKEQIAIDYRMGAEWQSAQLRAFFQLLMELSRSDPKASVTLDPKTLAEVADRFLACWSRFVSEHVY